MEERFLKLSNTAYKILEFLPESDPLKNKAKEKVLAILENLPIVFGTDGWISFQKDKTISQILSDIDIFLGYLEIAKNQRWLNQINYLILLKEYVGLKKEIPEPRVFEPKSEINPCLAGRQANIKIQNPKIGELTERQKKILEMLDSTEKAQVADIIKVLPNITKRTIRRDLDGLLEMGKVVRIGQWNQVFYQAFKKENNNRTIMVS